MAGMELLGYRDAIQGFDAAMRWADEFRDTVYIVGPSVEYAAYVEFGTSKMDAQPYLLPAAREVGRNPTAHINNPQSGDDLVRQIAFAIERKASENAPVDTGALKASIQAVKV